MRRTSAHSRPALPRTGFAGLLVGLTMLAAGCGDQQTITRYAAPKETTTREASTDERTSGPTAWFFKLEGPPEAVTEIEPQFTALVESVRFADDQPSWSLPEGWSQSGEGSGMRFATLTVDRTDPPLEVSVIPLPVFGDDIDAYVRQNIDRWRGQLGLQPMTGSDGLATARQQGEVRESTAGEVPVTFVDLTGKSESFDPARMLGAILLPAGSTGSRSRTAAPSLTATPPTSPQRRGSPISYETPASWEEGRASAMRAASFAVNEDDREIDISAIRAGGDELANVNRWRQQIGLEPISQEELEREAREIEVDGRTGRFFKLEGDTETILAVIVPSGGQSWFFKLMGDPALAAREQENFESFVKSVTFE